MFSELTFQWIEPEKWFYLYSSKFCCVLGWIQVPEERTVVLSMFSALCVSMSILLLGLALVLRVRNRGGNDQLPFWLRRLAVIAVHEKL